MKEEIRKIVEDAWEVFFESYDRKVSQYKYSKSKEEANSEHWICWNEYDLMLQFGRLFYKELNKIDIDSDIELHLEKNLSERNFKNFTFADKLPELRGNLKRAPKVDLIITSENSNGPFLICGEVKYFHYSVEAINRNTKTAEGVIEKDLKTLLKIKDLGIAENIIFIIFDDYYRVNKNKENEKREYEKIQKLLEKYNKKIKILQHDSRAKLR